ncbi:hypothetical protein [Halobaculum rubrum]|uniref:hypothetical protein n=1 Tax=Halobaculum rubrum TaxID=2872158 RepID=UPI001CA409CD|nr:hypothetical protein [Halobaculum rubrum]QZX99205.1 hypothetical protein K6T25_13210 [Halobaculum rubrum]
MTPDDSDTDDVTAPPDSAAADSSRSDEDLDRRRLIRWIAVLAFAVPVIVELLTFGGLIENTLFPGGDGDTGGTATDGTETATATPGEDAVGVGDELLPDEPTVETVEVSEVRGESASSRTYVLRVAVENTTENSVELRLTGVTLRDGASLESVSTTGAIPAGGAGEVTGAWGLPTDSMPVAVDVVLLRDGDESTSRSVPLKRPPIRG